MDRMELCRQLRNSTKRHYNCAQSVLIPFCAETGLSEERACALAEHFGGGMHMGATCGALTGGLMVLGLLGYSQAESTALIQRFTRRHGHLNCRDLLAANAAAGGEKKPHCDDMVYQMVADLDALLAQDAEKAQ